MPIPASVSVVIITRNAAATLRQTLDSVQDFDDVVIYDNGSSDDTLKIAADYPNVTSYEGEFLGFGPTKRHAVSLAKHDWIVSLDADEALSPILVEAILAWVDKALPNDLGQVLRENWMMGRPVRHSGWGNDWLIRLFNRQCHNFNDAMVHESIALSQHSRVQRLTGTITHTAVTDLSQLLEKVNRYSTIRADSGKLKAYPVPIVFIKALFAFIRTYLLQRGCLDGWRGLVIAVSNANGVFWKYMKNYLKTNR
ncbi:glycosyltransferase family 2 protein [Halomonas sp. GT]|uniref:glycosyltransferase family 2 protein n=1 Tax=Halomonas sp. GT TaxID=1971364 RepID=UPI0009F5CEAA|nr:glycosyltransferase family 2 protein [Halomonas sp. GT]